jgi:hypothetical protein
LGQKLTKAALLNFILSTGSASPQAVFGSAGPVDGLGTTLDLFVPLCEMLAERSGGAVVAVASRRDLGRRPPGPSMFRAAA